jgi:Domain of unknown function (DUF4386)
MNRIFAARLIALGFLLSTATYLVGNGFLEQVFQAQTVNKTTLAWGTFLVVLTGLLVVGVGMGFWAILLNRFVAVFYVCSRVLEAALLMVSVVPSLALLEMGQPKAAALMQNHGFTFAMLALGVGSVLLCAELFKTQLIPRWLSVLGLVGYVLLPTSLLLEFFGLGEFFVLLLPGAAFELVLPVWLLVKGFSLELQNSGVSHA